MDDHMLHHGKRFIFFDKAYLSEFVYGGIDGAITTFAVVAGAAGAEAALHWVLIFGFANLLADGFSMSVGNYFSVKSEQETYEKHVQIEYWEIEHLKEQEIEEVREIYRAKGFEGELLEQVVQVITGNKQVWVDTMMKEELEMIKEDRTAVKTALATFLSFNIIGLIPLLAYVFALFVDVDSGVLFPVSCVGTGIALLIVGYLRGEVTGAGKLKSMMQVVLLGGLAACFAYFVGVILAEYLL